MTMPIGDVLTGLEKAISKCRTNYEVLIGVFREIHLPANISSDELKRLYKICYSILQIPAAKPIPDLNTGLESWQTEHLRSCARAQIEATMFDRGATKRRWIEDFRARYSERGEAIPQDLNDSLLPAALNIPWDLSMARKQIRPFLQRCEEYVAREPSFHFKLCWDVIRDGYPVFQQIIAEWMSDLESRNLGVAETAKAIAKANDLYEMADGPTEISWFEYKSEILPLLDHPHAMVAAGAARYLGALMAQDCFRDDADAPNLVGWMERLRTQKNHRAAVTGGFICGFDTDSEGLHALTSDQSASGAAFDIDQWTLDILEQEKQHAFLPNAQAFWFYVHEYYAENAAFAMRLIEMDRAWIAMACATEILGNVTGMKPVLERLAKNSDPEIAEPAKAHLAQYYT